MDYQLQTEISALTRLLDVDASLVVIHLHALYLADTVILT